MNGYLARCLKPQPDSAVFDLTVTVSRRSTLFPLPTTTDSSGFLDKTNMIEHPCFLTSRDQSSHQLFADVLVGASNKTCTIVPVVKA